MRRSLLGLSQICLAKKLGKKTAQVRRIEEGAKDIKMPELHQYAEVLDVPVDYFFKGLDRPDPLEVALNGLSDMPQAVFERWDGHVLEFSDPVVYH
ncbi:MAG: helix-turn-helix transcriptional regulator [Rhodospirillales bacterium]|nr:helix-turn-helix transcriptional regulator [Rhodospirillales bacterium]